MLFTYSNKKRDRNLRTIINKSLYKLPINKNLLLRVITITGWCMSTSRVRIAGNWS